MVASKKSRPAPDSAKRIPAMTETIVDFDHPPVTEVICGIGFKKISGLRAPQMGLFWESIRKEFPIAEVKAPIASPGQVAGLSFVEGDDLPMRFFLRSEDKRELVQIQSDRETQWVPRPID